VKGREEEPPLAYVTRDAWPRGKVKLMVRTSDDKPRLLGF